MFYRPGKDDHGLPHDPFKINPRHLPTSQACVVPRPIGWISTLSPTGQANLAPYSQFNNLTFDPPYVMFSANQTPTAQQKDTVINTEATGKFCWNLATYDLREAVNITAEQTEYGVDEFEHAGLAKIDSRISEVDVNGEKKLIPMVRDSPVRFECEHYTTLRLPGNPPMGAVDVVIGRVVGIHIDERVLTDGKIDIQKTVPIARCGYYEYAVIRDVFEMRVPGLCEDMLAGLEGDSKKNQAILGREKKGVMRGEDAEAEKEG
ncbi:FMN binding [Ascochyta rabiei]|uniref:FMN binding n=1 Tax=Didymella rabiei TaxID=5454 RepID=A0A162XUT5_DIDRA|nr:FMN binding [Ascochyta rabiei]